MAFFKTKQEREIMEQMEREEQMQVFSEQIEELKKKREEYAKIAAEAEVNGDAGTYDVAVNALVDLNDSISGLMQTKANFDIINVSNSIASSMAMAMNALDKMADGRANLPDIRKIQKANAKIAKYMKDVKISQKAMAGAMKRSNPANRVRSEAEIAAVRPMIDAARAKMSGVSMPSAAGIDLSAEIEAEKNKII
ncbi:MAG TPA: hypothetical protein H9731_06105 [Candidatus Borkfalkia excrementipullorum]|nr:hypothetical protein [Candidatus Borkfalkia excrementipullorum]